MKIQLITTSNTEFTVEVSESNYENCIDSFIRGFEDKEVKAFTFIDEENKRDLDFNIWDYIYNDMQGDREDDEFYDFMNSNALKPIETLVMMQYGYYVEKGVERLYVVKLPQEMGCYDYFLTKSNGKVDITCFEGYPRNLKYHLTEAEIRGIWDGYMELAKEVVKGDEE
ncbi:TPA: DUF1642 domain-containing protein [Listeria monocytogenes]|nr:DUF1642 domain-containing protein [Listeria monocytogenes]